MAMEFQDRWCSLLSEFSYGIAAPEMDSEHPVIKTADILFSELQRNSRYRIRAADILGSVAKGTALRMDYDFDSVIYVDKKPPFKKVIKEFAEILLSSSCFHATKVRCLNGMLLQAFVNGTRFDIVPAVFFSEDMDQQRRCALQFIKRLKKPAKELLWSASLEESRAEFIIRQSDFVRSVVRIAKFWNKTVIVNSYVPGRTILMESIAVMAANQEETSHSKNPSILRAFKAFLSSVTDLDKLYIVFEMFYRKHEVLQSKLPVVMDPSNPYCNLASGLAKKPKVMEQFKSYARMTMHRLDSNLPEVPCTVESLFEMQPLVAPKHILQRSSLQEDPENWLIEVAKCNGDCSPNMVTRNRPAFNEKGRLLLQSYLWNNVKIVSSNYTSEEKLKLQVWDIISLNILGHTSSSTLDCTSPTKDHLEFDVTFEVPSGRYVIKLSLNWLPKRSKGKPKKVKVQEDAALGTQET